MMWLPVINKVATLPEVENYWSLDDLMFYISLAGKVNEMQKKEMEKAKNGR